MKISAVINTYNEESNLPRCLNAVLGVVSEIVIVDMGSTDQTLKIAKQFGARIYKHPYVGYVEPARNLGLEKAKGDWILLLDADELISDFLLQKLIGLAQNGAYQFVRIPRKNIIFDKWIGHTGWWPDYQIRFFKKNAVSWGEEIHSIPLTQGSGFDLSIEEKNALTHYHYQTISQFIERMNRYTSIEAEYKHKTEGAVDWYMLLSSPFHEFLSRFFAQTGYKDGLHGFVLSILQGISVFVVMVKVWEKQKFPQKTEEETLTLVQEQSRKLGSELFYWQFESQTKDISRIERFVLKLRKRLFI